MRVSVQLPGAGTAAEALGETVYGLGKLDAAHRAAGIVQKIAVFMGLMTHLPKDARNPSVIPHMARIAALNDTYGNPRISRQADIEALFTQAYKH